MRRHSLAVSDESDSEPEESREVGFRLGHQLYFSSSLEFRKKRTVHGRDFNDSGMGALSPRIQFLVDTDVFREDFTCDPHFGLPGLGGLAAPVLAAAAALVADVFEQLGSGSQLRLECDSPRAGVHCRIAQGDFNLQMTEVGATIAFSHAE